MPLGPSHRGEAYESPVESKERTKERLTCIGLLGHAGIDGGLQITQGHAHLCPPWDLKPGLQSSSCHAARLRYGWEQLDGKAGGPQSANRKWTAYLPGAGFSVSCCFQETEHIKVLCDTRSRREGRIQCFVQRALLPFFKTMRCLEFFRVNTGFQEFGMGLPRKNITSLSRGDQKGLAKKQIGICPPVFEGRTNTLQRGAGRVLEPSHSWLAQAKSKSNPPVS